MMAEQLHVSHRQQDPKSLSDTVLPLGLLGIRGGSLMDLACAEAILMDFEVSNNDEQLHEACRAILRLSDDPEMVRMTRELLKALEAGGPAPDLGMTRCCQTNSNQHRQGQ
jgi:hypothetical protein